MRNLPSIEEVKAAMVKLKFKKAAVIMAFCQK